VVLCVLEAHRARLINSEPEQWYPHTVWAFMRAGIEGRVGGGPSTIVISQNLTFSMCGAASLCANQQTLANCVLADWAAQGEPRIERDRPRVEFHSRCYYTAELFRIIFSAFDWSQECVCAYCNKFVWFLMLTYSMYSDQFKSLTRVMHVILKRLWQYISIIFHAERWLCVDGLLFFTIANFVYKPWQENDMV
jgi:hypothetical protein